MSACNPCSTILAEDMETLSLVWKDMQASIPHIQCILQDHLHLKCRFRWEGVVTYNEGDIVLLESFEGVIAPQGADGTVHPDFGMPKFMCPFEYVLVKSFSAADGRSQNPNFFPSKPLENGGDDILSLDAAHLGLARWTMLDSNPRIHQAERLMDLGRGTDRRTRAGSGGSLCEAHRGWNSGQAVHVRSPHLLHVLPGIGAQAIDKTTLSLRKKDVERHATLPAPGGPCDDHHLAPREIQRDIFQVVHSGAPNLDALRCYHRGLLDPFLEIDAGISIQSLVQCPSGMGILAAQGVRGPLKRICPPPLPPSGPKSRIRSAWAIMSRLCSITMTVLPMETSCWRFPISTWTSERWSPVVGSSRINKAFSSRSNER